MTTTNRQVAVINLDMRNLTINRVHYLYLQREGLPCRECNAKFLIIELCIVPILS
jgi:hypothetical protein